MATPTIQLMDMVLPNTLVGVTSIVVNYDSSHLQHFIGEVDSRVMLANVQ